MAGESRELLQESLSVFARVFDHRAVMRAEHKLMLKEFETSRNDREMLRLKEISQKKGRSERLLVESEELSQLRIQQCQTALENANEQCETVLNKDRCQDIRRAELKASRDNEMNLFREDMEKSLAEVTKLNEDRLATLGQ